MAELASQPTSIQTLYGWYRENKLFVNRRYQRKLVWTQLEKQKLVESILKKYPIPAILVAEREDAAGTYEIIDGLQRLPAIVSFIETSFPTLDGKLFALEFFPTAKSRADEGAFVPNVSDSLLSQREVTTLLDYSLALSVMRNASEAEVNDVFGRINTYGHRLSDQERRQAGVQNEFSDMVRSIACTIRGDASADVLGLAAMPSISIDLPMTKHGYEVQADEVVWVTEGILRSTDLRDSMDEQCIADIAACIVGGQLIERSKDALDDIFTVGSDESDRILNALNLYGADKFSEEFKYCFDEILKICAADGKTDKLRDIVFTKNTTNAFPSVFAILLISVHELVVREHKKAADYSGLKKAIDNVDGRLSIGRKATSPEERRKNIDTVKGLMRDLFVDADVAKEIYGSHATTDIDGIIRRSEIELAGYELKQGMLSLGKDRAVDQSLVEKVIKTIATIANNGPGRTGKLIIGVTDKDADAARAKELDAIEPKRIGKRYVVGVNREAKVMGLSVEEYFAKWKHAIKNSALSDHLKDAVLSSMDFNSYYDLGVIVITVPPQKELSFVGEELYWRDGDATKLADQPKQIANMAKRFLA
ncbi:DUF262 domain-containing protein [Paraburkholderia sp. BR14374]|uniref:GmrSD restriction endonuclease domain-containing protein n=1 Tax=Paraburkholderia sp. BR14374 TaxID=3237007 RepID=UPI0034CF79D5